MIAAEQITAVFDYWPGLRLSGCWLNSKLRHHLKSRSHDFSPSFAPTSGVATAASPDGDPPTRGF